MGTNFNGLRKLIIVPGHAVYIGREPSHIKLDEYWIGGYKGEGIFYAQHADAGVEEAVKNKDGLLVFSGGQTREQAGPLSEAQSYWQLENQENWLDYEGIRERATTEEFARNSFDNLEFSIHRFRRCTGEYPEKIFICGWGFKEERYRFHASTIRWDLGRFVYVPVNNPLGDPDDTTTPLGKAMVGERRTLELFKEFPLGNGGELLELKLRRDPFKRGNPHYLD